LDGVIAKLESGTYLPGKRAMIKVKHARNGRLCVSRIPLAQEWHDAIGSLLLGLYDESGSAPARRGHFIFHDGHAQAAREGAGAASQERDGPTTLGASGLVPRASQAALPGARAVERR